MTSGIYAIFNHETGDCYIGSSKSIEKRWANHRSSLKHNHSTHTHLQRAWNTYCESSFSFILLEVCPTEELIQSEARWWRFLQPEYNCGEPTSSVPKHTPETRAKMSKSMMGKTHTPEARAKMSAARRGKKLPPLSQEARKKLSLSKLGRKHTPEAIEKMKAAHRNISSETREKMRLAQLGKKRTPEHIANMSASMRGKPHRPTKKSKENIDV